MPANPKRYFLCTGQCVEYKDLYKHPKSHIIGELRSMTDEGRKVTALAIYERSVSAAEVPPIQPVIRMYVIGDARLIKCQYAGCVRSERWEIGKAAFMALMQRYQKEAPSEPV